MPPTVPPTPPTPPTDPNADWTAAEKKFFDDNGVTDEREKEVIRGRARVLAYDRVRAKHEAPPPEAPRKKWWED